MAEALGLSTYRWNNNLKSILLLAAFPLLLMLLLGALVYIYAWGFLADYDGVVRTGSYGYGYSPDAAGYGPLGYALDTIYAYWPAVVGVAVVWLLVAYAFNDV